ncbi:hypothetical protein K7432_011813 [Basidiobolus ranarum]|uniref:Major royal jelly protein n=1 Tax=Basidiobolus ranarum TaxID=34480 RepID=A0ABR2WLR6_9FUNG
MKWPTLCSFLIFGCQAISGAHGLVDPLKPTSNIDTMTFGPALEVVHEFHQQMPTGVAVSTKGRVFVSYPRWTNDVRYSVAEIINGKEIPYPSLSMHPETSEIQSANVTHKSFKNFIVSAQTIELDGQDRLWIVDTGSVFRGKTVKGGSKLICFDLRTNKVVKSIIFSDPVIHDISYINDARFDLSRGYAYITDSSSRPGLIIVNLKTMKAWRKLNEHPFTLATDKFVPIVEGVPIQPITNGVYGHMDVGSDGISLNADGTRLFWCPLSSRLLFSVDTKLLTDPNLQDTDLEKSVTQHGDKGGGADGLEIDSKDRLYMTNYEHNSINRFYADTGRIEPFVRDPRNIWPDTMHVTDGYLYWIANQINRESGIRPFYMFRVPIDAKRVLL